MLVVFWHWRCCDRALAKHRGGGVACVPACLPAYARAENYTIREAMVLADSGAAGWGCKSLTLLSLLQSYFPCPTTFNEVQAVTTGVCTAAAPDHGKPTRTQQPAIPSSPHMGHPQRCHLQAS